MPQKIVSGMAKIQFNRAQLSNPTPAGLNRSIRIATIVLTIVMAWMPTNNIVPHHVQDILTPVFALLLAIANGIAPFFGVEINSKTVPIEDVTAMESHTAKEGDKTP